jgi:hypothetical protein
LKLVQHALAKWGHSDFVQTGFADNWISANKFAWPSPEVPHLRHTRECSQREVRGVALHLFADVKETARLSSGVARTQKSNATKRTIWRTQRQKRQLYHKSLN